MWFVFVGRHPAVRYGNILTAGCSLYAGGAAYLT